MVGQGDTRSHEKEPWVIEEDGRGKLALKLLIGAAPVGGMRDVKPNLAGSRAGTEWLLPHAGYH